MRMLQIVSIGGAIGIALIAYSFLSPSCDLTPELARNTVNEELRLEHLDPRYLGPPDVDASGCTCSFSYSGQGRELEYIVLDDPIHGPKISTWDKAKQLNGP